MQFPTDRGNHRNYELQSVPIRAAPAQRWNISFCVRAPEPTTDGEQLIQKPGFPSNGKTTHSAQIRSIFQLKQPNCRRVRPIISSAVGYNTVVVEHCISPCFRLGHVRRRRRRLQFLQAKDDRGSDDFVGGKFSSYGQTWLQCTIWRERVQFLLQLLPTYKYAAHGISDSAGEALLTGRTTLETYRFRKWFFFFS